MHCFSDYDMWKLDPDRIWGAAPEEREEDPFEEWALDESERQFDMAASHDAEPELRHVHFSPQDVSDQRTHSGEAQ